MDPKSASAAMPTTPSCFQTMEEACRGRMRYCALRTAATCCTTVTVRTARFSMGNGSSVPSSNPVRDIVIGPYRLVLMSVEAADPDPGPTGTVVAARTTPPRGSPAITPRRDPAGRCPPTDPEHAGDGVTYCANCPPWRRPVRNRGCRDSHPRSCTAWVVWRSPYWRQC